MSCTCNHPGCPYCDVMWGSSDVLEGAASAAYAAYGAQTGHKNFQGNPMPTWDALPDAIRQAWRAATQRVWQLATDANRAALEKAGVLS
jgi:hypothetical protein